MQGIYRYNVYMLRMKGRTYEINIFFLKVQKRKYAKVYIV